MASGSSEVKLLMCWRTVSPKSTLGSWEFETEYGTHELHEAVLNPLLYATSSVEDRAAAALHSQIIASVCRHNFPAKMASNWKALRFSMNEWETCKGKGMSFRGTGMLLETLATLDPSAQIKLVLKYHGVPKLKRCVNRDDDDSDIDEDCNCCEREDKNPIWNISDEHTLTVILTATSSGGAAKTFTGEVDDDGRFLYVLQKCRNFIAKANAFCICHLDTVFQNSGGDRNGDPMAAFRTILHDKIGSDLTIVTKNGERIECHKSVLIVQSDVWKAMFEADCVESNTSTIIMEDMDEDVVRALLEFLYCRDLKAADESSQVALQLLSAANRYFIATLAIEIKNLILRKASNWFRLEDALKMFITAQGINGNGDEELVQKLSEVFKSKGSALGETPEFQDFFKAFPHLALKLYSATIAK